MSTSPRTARRVQAIAYTVVTSAAVLGLALTEWIAERIASDMSRAATTAVELAIVLVAALVFRPIHHRIERALDAAFHKRKRQALAALQRFRRELSSFNDEAQLLRRVVEALDHHLETNESAVYVRRDTFRAEASSFDAGVAAIPLEDPLVLRFQSSGAPAVPRALASAAPGTNAFPMIAAGHLLGFLCVACRHDRYDDEEMHMLSGIAQDLAAALTGLDPSLRPKREPRTNVPAGAAPLVGRDNDVLLVVEALQHDTRLVTGAGGIGKTRVALECAARSLEAFEDGVWFVDLAPVTDGALVASTILSSITGAPAPGDDALATLVEFLKPRTALLVIDNCEHVVDDAVSAIVAMRARCATVSILATSREILHVDGEYTYRLNPLDVAAAADLFTRRALSVSRDFDPAAHARAIAHICERLEGIPLAIELAAARMRVLGVEEIDARLDRKFALLTNAGRGSSARQQALTSTIAWSYDLLTAEERSLFRRLSAFRGSFSLHAAAAVCSSEPVPACDDLHVLDVLTSLVDKSLVMVTRSDGVRYRFLETIREFAESEAERKGERIGAAAAHASYFAALGEEAYATFDAQPGPGWPSSLVPDLDNFRSALAWLLREGGPASGARLAADCGPIFLRLELLAEGLRWCAEARAVPGLPCATLGRIEYVASMLHNNARAQREALACAERALAHLRRCNDERGLVRALSQVAQQYARAHRFDDARAPGDEAVGRARRLGDPTILVTVLRRCAYALPPARIEDARQLFREALEAARASNDADETSIVLQWWAGSEAAAGAFARAAELAIEGTRCAGEDAQTYLESDIACYLQAVDAFERSAPHALRGLDLAVAADHDVLTALGISWCAPLHVSSEPQRAALLFGYARARLRELRFEGDHPEKVALLNARRYIAESLEGEPIEPLLERGARLDRETAMRMLAGPLAARGRHYPAVESGDRVGALLS